MMKTRVGKHIVEVRSANYPALWHFSSGEHGRREAGVYAFWCAVLRPGNGKGRIVGRALAVEPPGDRFDRVKREQYTARSKEDRDAYRRLWREVLQGGKAIRYIRPCTGKEVERWLDGHAADAKFARRIQVK